MQQFENVEIHETNFFGREFLSSGDSQKKKSNKAYVLKFKLDSESIEFEG